MQTLDLFKALSDEVRLRILKVVSVAELSVAELVSVLGLPQSTVSRHLKPLRDADLVETRREGTSSYYRKGPALSDPALARLLQERLDALPQTAEDVASVRRVMEMRRARSRDFFDRVAGSYGTLTQPGGGWEPLAAAFAAGFEGKVVADLGAGEGALTLLVARFARKVIAVDSSLSMLEQVRDSARRAGVERRIELADGDLEHLPIEAALVDVAILSQTLHHAANPPAAIREAARILKPGGLLLVLDLLAHSQEWVREQWADQWLGFAPTELCDWITSAGMTPGISDILAGSTPELSVLLVTARRNPT